MVRRILALVLALGAIISPAVLLGALYLHEHVAPPKTDYVPVCGAQYNGLPCASLDMLLTAGAVLRVAGAILCMLAVLLGALLLLRLTRWPRLAVISAVTAAFGGVSALWFSQQALKAFQSYSLLPWSFPAMVFTYVIEYTGSLARAYLIWSVAATALLFIILAITLSLLWRSTGQCEANEPEAGDERRFSINRALALGAFAPFLLAPAVALGMVFELDRAAPCQQQYDPACFSLDAMVAAGAVIRGAGAVLVGLAILLGCVSLQHSRPRWPIAPGAAIVALASGLWLMWFSQRVLDDYLSAPWNAETYSPGAFDGRVEVLAQLARMYVLWSAGAVALASVVTLVGLMILRRGGHRRFEMTPLAPTG
jgi:hypothetical protein